MTPPILQGGPLLASVAMLVTPLPQRNIANVPCLSVSWVRGTHHKRFCGNLGYIWIGSIAQKRSAGLQAGRSGHRGAA